MGANWTNTPGDCTRVGPHLGPCNGYATPKCGGYVSPTERKFEAWDSKLRLGHDHRCPKCVSEKYACFEKHRILALEERVGDEKKESNPKDAIGVTKLPLSLVPQTAIGMASLALLDGALKYGKFNWRVAGVRVSVYLDACRRHLAKWENGEEIDSDSGLPHLAHALACLAIIVDAKAAGKLTDDRPPSIDIGASIDEMTKHVGRLLEKHKDKHPQHFTIADTGKKP